MEALLDFTAASPLIFLMRGALYFLRDVFLGSEGVMTIVDVLTTFFLGVCLPSWDVYSDIGLAYYLIRPTCRNFVSAIDVEKHLNFNGELYNCGKMADEAFCIGKFINTFET